ncbi:MAG: PQQ-binding-like beta-propeller repeat protein [Bryobacterales bacterium]|nr:PQQ-binding-like beta-propeller repeat protein [Bryobacterales bacterium]
MRRYILLSLFVTAAGLAADAGWTQFRGPERTGNAPGPNWPDSLAGLEELWRVPLDKGYPGPIVDTKRVYVAETAGGDTEVVRALDRKSGKELWRASWPGKLAVPFFAKKNGDWIRSTPALSDGVLYVGGMEEVLVALDAATGRECWRVDFPKRFGTPKPDFGYSSSPLIDGDALYTQAANSVVKLNKRTGETIWRVLERQADIMDSGAFSSPVIAAVAGKRQLLVQSRTTLHGIDPDNGKLLWTQDVPHYRGMNILMPSVWQDKVFTSSYRNDTYLFEISPAPAGGFASKERWRNKAKGYMASPVILNGYAYLHLANQRFTCIDLRTGETKWTTEPYGMYWSMAVRGGKILALDERGQLLLLRATPEKFDLLATREVTGSPAWAHIAVVDDEVFIRDLTGVTAYRWSEAKLSQRRSSRVTPSWNSASGVNRLSTTQPLSGKS